MTKWFTNLVGFKGQVGEKITQNKPSTTNKMFNKKQYIQ